MRSNEDPGNELKPRPSRHLSPRHTRTLTISALCLAPIETRIRDLEAAVISAGGQIPRREKRRLISNPETGEEEAMDYVVSTNDSAFLPQQSFQSSAMLFFNFLRSPPSPLSTGGILQAHLCARISEHIHGHQDYCNRLHSRFGHLLRFYGKPSYQAYTADRRGAVCSLIFSFFDCQPCPAVNRTY